MKLRKLRKLMAGILVVLMLIAAIGCSSSTPSTTPSTTPTPKPKPAEKTSLIWGTMGVGSSDHMRATAIASVVNKYSDKVNIVLTPAKGSTDALYHIVVPRDIDFTLSLDMTWSWALDGKKVFEEVGPTPREKMPQYMYFGFGVPIDFIVPKGSDIKTIADLKGKKVLTNPPAASMTVVAEGVMSCLGVEPGVDCEWIQHKTYAEITDAMVNGEADAVVIGVSYPAAFIIEMAERKDIEFRDISESVIPCVKKERNLGLLVDIIPAGVYKGVSEVSTVFTPAYWMAKPELDEALVYEVTKQTWEHIDEIKELYVGCEMMKTGRYGAMPDWHPGAKQALMDLGLYLGD